MYKLMLSLNTYISDSASPVSVEKVISFKIPSSSLTLITKK